MSHIANNHISPVVIRVPEAWESNASNSPRRRSIIRDFALNTSTHGLPGIARSQSKHNCIFWTISFLCFATIMIYFVSVSIRDYFQYPTQTSVSIIVERSQTFPAVTFCNYAPARYDRIITSFLNYMNSMNLTNTNDTTIFTYQQAYLLRGYLQSKLNAGEPVDEYFFSIDTMLINCTYNGEICTKNDFISFLSSEHGLCFTFNAQTKSTNDTDVRHTNDNGGSGTLHLGLYAQSHLYVPYISQDVSAGIVAMVHDNTQLPRIDIAGIELAPGRKHKLGYKKKTTYFLPSPYTECTDKIPRVMQAMFDKYAGADYAYSQSICYILCTQAFIYQQCGCANPFEWSARTVVLPVNNTIIDAPLCQPDDTCYSDAATRISNTTSIWNEFCSNCNQECSNVDFTVTTSSVSAPSMLYAQITKFFLESSGVPLPTDWQTNWLTEVQNNYVELDVVCESSQTENYTQEASVTPVDVLSNVGGQTGLWIGISFLSAMELVEMICRLIRTEYFIIIRRLQNKFHKNNQ